MQATSLEVARHNMVEQQIRPCDVIDENVLSAIRTVPREQFVPEDYQQLAFADIHIPLNSQSVMMKPIQEGLMLQALDAKPGDRILEVGTGSGFVTACLAKLGEKVVSYEMDETLSQQAAQRLESLGIRNVRLVVGDIFQAGLEAKYFDVIAVTGSVSGDTEMLQEALAPGGRMFIVKGEEPIMKATLITRDQENNLYHDELCETVLPPLQNAPQVEQFTF